MNKQLLSKEELLEWIKVEWQTLEDEQRDGYTDYWKAFDKGRIYELMKIREGLYG